MIYYYFSNIGKTLYVQRLYEKLERQFERGTTLKKCIRLTTHEVDDHKVLQSLYDTPKQKDITVFHIDVTSSVSSVYVTIIMKDLHYYSLLYITF